MAEEPPRKCFCTRCFLPIVEEDKVDIGGQNFHRMCSTCCVCRNIPTSIKMFYGHVFCSECFKAHVLGHFKESPQVHCNSWWGHWAPGTNPHAQREPKTSESSKKYICSRCLQSVDEKEKVEIGGQHFHPQCAKCYFCHTVPTSNLKIYYGQVFCEDCFHRHVMNRGRDNPSEFFKCCFEQWQNAQFAENMKSFMGGSKEGGAPFVFCRCSGQNEWGAQPDTSKSATPGRPTNIEMESLEDFYFENRTEMSDIPESSHIGFISIDDKTEEPNEKIEKLTKYLHSAPSLVKEKKKWKNFVEFDKISPAPHGWVDLQEGKVNTNLDCPKCLWQCGPIFVQSKLLQAQVCCRGGFQ